MTFYPGPDSDCARFPIVAVLALFRKIDPSFPNEKLLGSW